MNLFRTKQRRLTLFSEAHLVKVVAGAPYEFAVHGNVEDHEANKNSRDVIRSSKITVISIWTKGNKMFLGMLKAGIRLFFLLFEGKKSLNSKDKRKQFKENPKFPALQGFFRLPRLAAAAQNGKVGRGGGWE